VAQPQHIYPDSLQLTGSQALSSKQTSATRAKEQYDTNRKIRIRRGTVKTTTRSSEQLAPYNNNKKRRTTGLNYSTPTA
jgi:hypothetical protein